MVGLRQLARLLAGGRQALRARTELLPRPLRRDRGTIFLETALVLPLFLCLLCFCMDLPRFLVVKQRVVGASRLVAEVRARNSGANTIKPAQLGSWFFDDPAGKNIKLTISDPGLKRSLLGGIIQTAGDWLEKILGPVIPKIIGFLVDLMTGGNLKPYFFNVLDRDVFYGAQVDAEVKTLLPAAAYASFAGKQNFSETYTISAVTYMPSLDSCKYTGESFIAKLLDKLHEWF